MTCPGADWPAPSAAPGTGNSALWDGPLGEEGGHVRLREERIELMRKFFALADDASPPDRMSVELQQWWTQARRDSRLVTRLVNTLRYT
jgi:hypothetical protein